MLFIIQSKFPMPFVTIDENISPLDFLKYKVKKKPLLNELKLFDELSTFNTTISNKHNLTEKSIKYDSNSFGL